MILLGVECLKMVYCTQMRLYEGLMILFHQHKRHGSIYKKGKDRRQLYNKSGSRERQLMLDLLPISMIARL